MQQAFSQPKEGQAKSMLRCSTVKFVYGHLVPHIIRLDVTCLSLLHMLIALETEQMQSLLSWL